MIFRFNIFRHILFVAVLLLSSLWSWDASASHYAAGDIRVDWDSTGNPGLLKCRIILDVYKACDQGSIDLSGTESVTISSASLSYSTYLTLDTIGSGVGINGNDTTDQLCPQFKNMNSCRMPGSQWMGFVRRRYKATFIFPSQAADWEIVWTNGSRNQSILNLCGGNPNTSIYNITVKCGYNNLFRYNNSSPRFTVAPVPYFCINKPAVFNNGCVDPNGDSLVVTYSQPMGCTGSVSYATCTNNNTSCGANTEIPYQTPYTVSNPLPSSSGYTVDSNAGATSFTPTLTGKYVLAFRAYEYDQITHQLVGYVTRDCQIVVLNCSAGSPSIDSTATNIQGIKANGNVLIGCPNSSFSFNVKGNSANNLYLDANNATSAPGSNFVVTGQNTPNPTATFTWNPTNASIGDHLIDITATDSVCTISNPIATVSHLIVLIKIVPGIDAGPDKFGYCALNGDPIQLEVNAGPGVTGLNFKWTALNGGPAVGLNKDNIYNPKATVSTTTSYVVFTNDLAPSCRRRDTVTINADASNTVQITPGPKYIMCRPGYLQLSATAGGPPPLRNLTCGLLDTVNCVNQDSIDVIPVNTTPLNTTTNPNSTPFYGSYATMRHQYLLHASDLKASGLHSSTLKSLSFKISGFPATTINNFKISLKCTGLKKLDASTGVVSGTTLVYSASGPVTLPATGGYIKFNFDAPYSWDTSQNLIVDVCYSNTSSFSSAYTFYMNTPYQSALAIGSTSGNLCGSTSGTYTIYASQIPQMRFNFCNAPSAPFSYTWKMGNLLSDSTIQNPVGYIAKSVKYIVSTSGRNGCIVKDSVDIYVPIHHVNVTPKDTAICEGESVVLTATGGHTYKWYEDASFSKATSLSCDTCASPVASPLKDRTYYLVIADSVNCTDTITQHITVKPLPKVKILNNDTVIKYGTSLQLLASGAYLYYWTPVSSLSDPNVVNPVATPVEPTIYSLVGLGSNGCRNFDSVTVSIDYRNALLIPTAFSPNGDSKNDVFRIANLTFQKLYEFRVFNRWGQEIFTTNDNNKGWDGTWKGVAQDMGVYNYVIRVGYPDGYVETYKGDITLIR